MTGLYAWNLDDMCEYLGFLLFLFYMDRIKMTKKTISSKVQFSFFTVLFLLFSSASQASLLGVSQENPDFFSSNILISSDGTKVSGDLVRFDLDDVFSYTASGSFSFDLSTKNGEIFGTVSGMGWSNESLLTGTITAFGDNGVSGNLPTLIDILFSVTGGAAASLFGPTGGIIIDLANPTAIVSDTFKVSSVPVPAAVWLFGTGLIGLVAVTKRKQIT